MSGIRVAARALRKALSGFDPALYTGEDCAGLVEELARTEKACAAARARAASRAAECSAHRERGFSNPSEWLARATGESSGKAKSDLELVASLDELSLTKEALASGELSLEEGREIAKTEEACPGTQAHMLKTAKKRGLRGLKEEGRRLRLEAIDPEDLSRRRHALRELRDWKDQLGMVCGRFRLEPEIGVPFLHRLTAEIDRAWQKGNAEYRAEPREARAADAFSVLVGGGGKPKAHRSELVVVFDQATDRAHIPGVGPIGYESLREIAKASLVTALLHDGVEVKRFIRYGKHIPAALRTLLEIGPPPNFEGLHCLNCGRRYHLEIDHLDPRANGGPTSNENLRPECPECHEDKTEADRKAGLLGGGHKSRRQQGRGPP